MQFDIYNVISKLSQKRKVFVSEADFQFELAWIIKEEYPDAKVRLEYCPEFERNMHIDILVIIDGKWIPIELKYKTKAGKYTDGETFALKEHSAKDIGCYLYLSDIQRIERIKDNVKEFFWVGYTVFLTNDLSYLAAPKKADCIYKEFSLEQGIVKSGVLNWAENASDGSKKGNERPIILKDEYQMRWRDYSIINEAKSGTFKILINEII